MVRGSLTEKVTFEQRPREDTGGGVGASQVTREQCPSERGQYLQSQQEDRHLACLSSRGGRSAWVEGAWGEEMLCLAAPVVSGCAGPTPSRDMSSPRPHSLWKKLKLLPGPPRPQPGRSGAAEGFLCCTEGEENNELYLP